MPPSPDSARLVDPIAGRGPTLAPIGEASAACHSQLSSLTQEIFETPRVTYPAYANSTATLSVNLKEPRRVPCQPHRLGAGR